MSSNVRWFSDLGMARPRAGRRQERLARRDGLPPRRPRACGCPTASRPPPTAYRALHRRHRAGRADRRAARRPRHRRRTPPRRGRQGDPRRGRRAAVPGRPRGRHPRGLRPAGRGVPEQRDRRSPCAPARPPRTCPTPRSPASRRPSSTSAASTPSCTAIREVFASLYNDRAIAYRVHHGFAHGDVALSAGVQRMVRSDIGASGVMFTMDTESGFTDAVFVTSAYGLGEGVVQGAVNPDEFYVYKPALRDGRPAVLKRGRGRQGDQDGLHRRRDRRAAPPSSSTSTRPSGAGSASPTTRSRSWPGTRWSSRSTTAGRWTSSGARTASTAGSTSSRRGPRRCSRAATGALERFKMPQGVDARRRGAGRGPRDRPEDRRRRGPGARRRVEQMQRVQPGRGAGRRHDRPRLGADHEARRGDRHQPRRPHLPRRDHRPRARHPGGGRHRLGDQGADRRPRGDGLVRRGRHRAGLRGPPRLHGRADRARRRCPTSR